LITVTEEAKALISTQDTPEGTVLRLDPIPEEGRVAEEVALGFTAGEPKEDDQVVEHEGEQVLRVARTVSEMLNGSTVDVVTEGDPSPDGSGGPRVGIGIKPPATPETMTDDS